MGALWNMSEVEVPAVAKKIKTFFKKLAIFLKKLAVFFENDLIFLRNTLVFEHVVFIYVRISLYNCIGLWICTYVKECVLLDERNTCSLHFYVFTGDSHFRFGFRICWWGRLLWRDILLKCHTVRSVWCSEKKIHVILVFFSSFLMEKCKRWFFQRVGYFIHVWWKCPVKDDIKSFCQRYQSILSKIPIKVYTINHLPLLCWQTRMEITKIVYNLKT